MKLRKYFLVILLVALLVASVLYLALDRAPEPVQSYRTVQLKVVESTSNMRTDAQMQERQQEVLEAYGGKIVSINSDNTIDLEGWPSPLGGQPHQALPCDEQINCYQIYIEYLPPSDIGGNEEWSVTLNFKDQKIVIELRFQACPPGGCLKESIVLQGSLIPITP